MKQFSQTDLEEEDLNKRTSDAVAQRLKTYFDTITEAPVPDKFTDLLKRLDEAAARPAQNGK